MRTQNDINTLTAALQQLSHGTNTQCAFARLLTTLPPDVQKLTYEVSENPQISHRSIHTALRKSGANIARESVADHRTGRCTCTKEQS